MAVMLNGKAAEGFDCVSNFANSTRVESCAAASANAGAIIRQGPHHGAQKSTSMGSSVRAMNFANVTSVSTTGCAGRSSSLHLPQMGLSVSFDAETRFTELQKEQTKFIFKPFKSGLHELQCVHLLLWCHITPYEASRQNKLSK